MITYVRVAFCILGAVIIAAVFTPMVVSWFSGGPEYNINIWDQGNADRRCMRLYKEPCPTYFEAEERFASGLRSQDPQGQFVPYEEKK